MSNQHEHEHPRRKANVLTRLRIDEVSSVNRGAGDGVRIALMKKQADEDLARRLHDKRRDLRHQLHDKIAAALGLSLRKSHTAIDTAITALAKSVASIDAAHPQMSLEKRRLLDTTFAQFERHLIKQIKGKGDRMTTDNLHDYAKSAGDAFSFCKSIVNGARCDLSEIEFTKVLTEQAQRTFPGMSPASAFAKLFQDQSVREAHRIVKNQMLPDRFASGGSNSRGSSEPTGAYALLVGKANDLRRRFPHLSEAQAFSKAYSENPALAQMERHENRPA